MNNHDTSTSGVNLDLSCSYDTFMSQQNWNESFTNISRQGGSLIEPRFFNVDIYQFVDCGNFKEKSIFDLDNYSDKTKHSIKLLLLDKVYVSVEGAREAARDMFDKSYSQLTVNELLELLNEEMESQYCSSDYIDFYREYFTPKYETITIRGYSQGDYAEVIFFHEDMKEYKYKDEASFISKMSDYFTHLFYDAPVYCRLTIDNEEDDPIFLDEALTDSYEWDRDLVLQYAKDNIEHEKKAYILEWLDDNLPEYPNYE